jgi:predicted DNA-binding transcriptional regulator YafY
MEAAYLLNQRFVKPVDFDLNVYLANEEYFQSGMKVILRFLPEWVHVAYDNRYDWETMVTQPDGSLLVTFTSPDIHWASNTALSYGALVEVVEPAELRAYVAKQVQILAKRYETEIQ